jgi:tetratricopeptide (TPR) repeat protein
VKLIESHYRLENCGGNEWRFQESSEMQAATEKFDVLLEKTFHSPSLAALYKILTEHPNHIDVLHHYASLLQNEGKHVEGLAFSYMAVAIGMRAFPKQFLIGQDMLPTGFVANRPFLRALHGLMVAQRTVDLVEDAITTAETCLALDRGDRMGARESLANYLMESGRDRAALQLFENPIYKDTFFATEYLHALALIRLAQEEQARNLLRKYLDYYPQVARFILNHRLPQPINEDNFGGVTSGSELEGWIHARYFGALWRSSLLAMKILREESRPYAKQNWKRYLKRHNS